MKKKIALLIYPEFSLQEVTNLLYLFRWNYDTKTDVFYSEKVPVSSEEGITLLPHKTYEEFYIEEYDCLILPGCSDCREAIHNHKLKTFLESFQNHKDFLIGAICAGPMFLAQAGLLKDKKYTCSLFVEMMERLTFMDEENFVCAPVVEDGMIITAGGSAFNDFAVHIAKKLGYECRERILSGYMDNYGEEDYLVHLPDEELREFEEIYHGFLK